MFLFSPLDIFHPEVDLLPQEFVVVSLGIDNLLNLKQVLLNAFNFLINLELDGPLLQNAVLQVLYVMLVCGKIAMLFGKGCGYVLLCLHFLDLLLLFNQAYEPGQHFHFRPITHT